MVKAGYRIEEIRSMSRPEIETRIGLIQKVAAQKASPGRGSAEQGRRLISRRNRIIPTA